MPNAPSRCNFLESIKTKRAGLGTAKEPQKGQKGQMGYWDIGILGYWDIGIGPALVWGQKAPKSPFALIFTNAPHPPDLLFSPVAPSPPIA